MDDHGSRAAPRTHIIRSVHIDVAIVDDHAMLVEGLSTLLDAEPDLEVVGTAGTVADALELVGAHRPNVVVMDFNLPDGDGASATAEILRRWPETKVVMFSAAGSEDLFARAVEAGCSGFVPKDQSSRQIASAIRAAHRGESVMPTDVLAALLSRLRRPAPIDRSGLTARELEVLGLLAQGMSTEQIRAELFLSENTVRNHIQRVLSKLGAHSKLEAVAAAVRDGIVSIDPGARP